MNDSVVSFEIFSLENPIKHKNFEEFFKIIKASFPKTERRTKAAFYTLCKNEPMYKIYAAKIDGKICSFFTLWEFKSFRFGDHFATDSSMRNLKLGTKLLDFVLKDSDLPLVIEVEPQGEEISDRRISFYKRNGFVLNDFDYMLPPMIKGMCEIPMQIMSFPKELSDSEFSKIKEQIYKKVYNK